MSLHRFPTFKKYWIWKPFERRKSQVTKKEKEKSSPKKTEIILF